MATRWTRSIPELSVLPHHLKARTAILDAEIVSLDSRASRALNNSSFGSTRPRPARVALLRRHHPVTLYVFDVMYTDGLRPARSALEDRKEFLRELLTPSDTIRYSEAFGTDGKALLEAGESPGNRGRDRKTPRQLLRIAARLGLD
ncbi:MAG: hypothetical protein WDO18_04505 [Acidobacteriota bacterium]